MYIESINMSVLVYVNLNHIRITKVHIRDDAALTKWMLAIVIQIWQQKCRYATL